MNKKTKKVKNNFEYIFVGILLVIMLGTYFGSNLFAQPSKNLNNEPVVSSFDANSDEYKLIYNQFWQHFNSIAMQHATAGGIISQADIDLYKMQFIKFYDFQMDDNKIFLIKDSAIVHPAKLKCYLINYNLTPPNSNPSC